MAQAHDYQGVISDDTILQNTDFRAKLDKIIQSDPRPFTDTIESDVDGVPIVCFRSVYGDNFLFNREPIITVGRSDYPRSIHPSFDLGDRGIALGVSRRHAKIAFIEGKFYVMDLDSTNGTQINDKLIVPHQMMPIYENDKITFGMFIVHVVWIS
jgi:pSer/pThr/pTyr-binding forkhead associated (FHA) protein